MAPSTRGVTINCQAKAVLLRDTPTMTIGFPIQALVIVAHDPYP